MRRFFSSSLSVAIAIGLIVLPACVPQPAPNPPIGGGGGGTLTPPPASNSNRNANRNANRNSNSTDSGPPRPNTNSNANANTNTNVNANQNANANANQNTNVNANDNVNANQRVPGSPLITAFADAITPECTIFRSNQFTLVEGNAPVTWSIRSGPPGMTISSASRRVTWNAPNFGFLGTYTVQVAATNALGEDIEDFVITVEPLFDRVLERLSNSLIGAVPDKESTSVSLSSDGNLVVFQSDATNLVANDTNGVVDIFLLDRAAGALRRLSLTAAGDQLTVPSITPVIAADGGFVAFQTFSGALAPDDSNNSADVFVIDLAADTIELVSRASDGTLGLSGATDPAISADGRFVAFASLSDNLVASDTNLASDIFVRDRQTGTTTRVSIATDGTEADGLSRSPVISPNGRFVAFVSEATNLVTDDANAALDVFVHDRDTGETTRVSLGPANAEIPEGADGPSITGASGEFITFITRGALATTDVNGLSDVYLRNRLTGVVTLVSTAPNGFAGNDSSTYARISPDGNFVAFESQAADLVAGDPNNSLIDIFVRNLSAGTTQLVSLNDDLESGNGASFRPAIARNGVFVAFESKADNLTCPDDFDFTDVFGKPLLP
ncbi:MAG: hypothetical protein SF069_05385 [Phycisphaerae bacterium]|nr:hypothetical protein [Phycisphaerae bacterium]